MNEIFCEGVEYFWCNCKHLLCQFDDRFIANGMELNAGKIQRSGAALEDNIGFIDGKNIRITTKPAGNAHLATYGGYKIKHCSNLQASSLPNQLMLHINGLLQEKTNCITLRRIPGIRYHFSRALPMNRNQYYIYRDPGYLGRPYTHLYYNGSNIEMISYTAEQSSFNRTLSHSRTAI